MYLLDDVSKLLGSVLCGGREASIEKGGFLQLYNVPRRHLTLTLTLTPTPTPTPTPTLTTGRPPLRSHHWLVDSISWGEMRDLDADPRYTVYS